MKRFIGILVAVSMLISAMPVWAATSEVEENLLDKGGVVYTSSSAPQYSIIENIYDNNSDTLTYVYNSGKSAWVQAELHTAMQITKVVLKGRHNGADKNGITEGSTGISVYLSNTPDFADSTYIDLGTTGSEGLKVKEEKEFIAIDTNKYKYIRFMAGSLLVLGEVDVYGYYESIDVDSSKEVNLFDKGAVYSGGGKPYSDAYVWQNAFDNKKDSGSEVYLQTNGYVQAEFVEPVQITKVIVTGRPNSIDGTESIKAWLSNDGINWIYAGMTPASGIAKGTEYVIEYSDARKYRYVKLCKGNATSPSGTVGLAEVDVMGYLPDVDTDKEVNILDKGAYTYTFNDTEPYSGFEAKNAFDNKVNTNSYIQKSGGHSWIQIDLYAPMTITKVNITGRYNNADGCANHHIYFSNDADFSTYYYAGTTGSSSFKNDIKSISGNTINKYKYIRVCGGTFTDPRAQFSLAEIDVYGYFPALEMETNISSGATNVTDDLVITFNQPLKTSTVKNGLNGSMCLYSSYKSKEVQGTGHQTTQNLENHFAYTLSADADTITIPVNQLRSNTNYTLKIDPKLQSVFSEALAEEQVWTFKTGNVDNYTHLPANAYVKNLISGKVPSATSDISETNFAKLTNDDYFTNISINKGDDGKAYATYDLLNSYDISAIELAWGFGGYSINENIRFYGSNNADNYFENEITSAKSAQTRGSLGASASNYSGIVKLIPDTVKNYRYITICNNGSSIDTINEIAVYGAVTSTLDEQNYEILPCNISTDVNGNYVATTGITNAGTEAVDSPVFILAIYDETDDVETLVATDVIPSEEIAAGSGKKLTATIPVEKLNNKTFCKVKFFIFNNMSSLTPISKTLAINVAK